MKSNIKSILIISFLLSYGGNVFGQSIGIGTNTPDTSAILDLTSTTKGVLFPRMTSAERKAIPGPANGLLVYDTDTESLWSHTSTGWKNLSNALLPLEGLRIDTCVLTEHINTQNTDNFDGEYEGSNWQSFTPAFTGYFTRFSFYGNSTGMNTFRIRQGQGTGGAIIYSTSFNAFSNHDWHDIILPDSTIILDSGSVYTIQLLTIVSWQTNLDGYNGGISSIADHDFIFKIFVKACINSQIFRLSNDFENVTLSFVDSIQFHNGASLNGYTGNNRLRLNGPISALQGITDLDGNTSINLESSPDIITFNMAGTPYFTMDGPRLNVLNSGRSVYIGEEAGSQVDNSIKSAVFVGYHAGKSNIGGVYNIAIGDKALEDNQSGSRNTAIGYLALQKSLNYNDNTAVGAEACSNIVDGTDNVAVGRGAINALDNSSNNVAIGSYALGDITGTMTNTVAVGYEAGRNANGNGGVLLGPHAGKGRGINNKLFIDNSDTIAPLIWGDFAQNIVRVNGKLSVRGQYTFPDIDGTAGQVLETDGAGHVSWSDLNISQDDQYIDTFALNGSTLSISLDGDNQPVKTIDLSPLSVQSLIQDANGDTEIQVEKFPDENRIRFKVNGHEAMKIDPNGYATLTGLTNTQLNLTKSDPSYSSELLFSGGSTTYKLGTPAGGSDRWRIWSDSVNAEVFTLLPEGNIGIGTSNPQEKLHVNGRIMISDSTRAGLTLKSTDNLKDNGIAFRNSAGNYTWSMFRTDAGSNAADLVFAGGNSISDPDALNERMRILKTGQVGIATSTPGYALQVGNNGDGTEARANAWTTFSDRRWKTDFQVVTHALEKINAIHGYYYKWKDRPDTTTQVGVIAQEIEAVLPEIVSTDAEGYKSVDYSKLSALLIEGLKEQEDRIQAMKTNQEELRTEVNSLKAMLLSAPVSVRSDQ